MAMMRVMAQSKTGVVVVELEAVHQTLSHHRRLQFILDFFMLCQIRSPCLVVTEASTSFTLHVAETERSIVCETRPLMRAETLRHREPMVNEF
jgi:hypothetical protein